MSLTQYNLPNPLPTVTITYTVDHIEFRNRSRVIVPCTQVAPPTMTGSDPDIELRPGPDGRLDVVVHKREGRREVNFCIAVKTDDGMHHLPTGIFLRYVGGLSLQPASFNGAWKITNADGIPVLVLSDNGFNKRDFEFDLLFRDDAGLNYAVLDPRLTNS